MHHRRQQVAFRVYRDVPLAALDFLARVIAAPPFLAPSLQTANPGSLPWAVSFDPLLCAPVRAASRLCAPTRRCRARRESAHALSSRVENCSATDAIGSRFSPRRAGRPPLGAAHIRRSPSSVTLPAARPAAAPAGTTAYPSSHSGRCPYAIDPMSPRI